MMWKCFRLVFEIKSPIHIGYGARLGIVEKTRYYVPGKTIWGAVTAKIAREIGGNYEKVGEFVRKHLRFTYFYLKNGNKIYYPLYEKEKGLKFGDLSKEEFEKKFITSFVSTALEKNSKTAEEGSLHEYELISNRNSDTGEIVEIVGYLFTDLEENSGKSENSLTYFVRKIDENSFIVEINGVGINLFKIIEMLQIGGERIYGFGKIKLKDRELEKKEKINFYNLEGVKVNLQNLEIMRNFLNPYKALSHVKIDKIKFKQVNGDLEPLVMREWNKIGVGQNPKFEGIYLVPGTVFELEEGQKIEIGEYGIWQANGQLQKKS